MGKRKSSKNKGPSGARSKKTGPVVLVGLILAVLTTVYFATKPSKSAEIAVEHEKRPAGMRLETRPALTSALFTGRAALAYKYAAEIPDVIDSQFCYCYCKKNHGHKTLLTCFTNEHGAKCDTCIEEVIYAYELHQQGKSVDEIVAAVDKKFYRPYQTHQL